MLEQQEQVLNEETWPAEAEAAINDIKKHVKAVAVSRQLENTNQHIYINLTTLENLHYCIEMSSAGFKILGHKYDDTTSENDGRVYETPYALLNTISKQYRESFGGELMNKLLDLAKNSESG